MLPDMDQLSLAQQVTQMVVVRVSGFLIQQLQDWVQILLLIAADILMMSIDPHKITKGICEAVKSRLIQRSLKRRWWSQSRISQSVECIWQAKAKVFPPQVSTLNLIKSTAEKDSNTIVADILQHSQISQVPVHSSENLINAIKLNYSSTTELHNGMVVDDLLKCDFFNHQVTTITLPTQRDYIIQIFNSYTPAQAVQNIEHLTLSQIFIRGNLFRGSASLTQLAENLLKKLLINANLRAFVMYGSPYTLKRLILLLTADTPIVFFYGEMPAAQNSALGSLFSI